MKIKVIIPASGKGKRFGGKALKQFLKIKGKEILAHTIEKFNSVKEIDEIIVATGKENVEIVKNLVKKYSLTKVTSIVSGGKERQDSVYNALNFMSCSDNDIILIHDAVRPFVSTKLIKEIIKSAKRSKNVIPGLKVSDTLKRTDAKGIVQQTIPRDNVWSIQTPQAFNYKMLSEAFKKARRNKFIGTDEAMLMERYGFKVKVISGEKSNIKITVKEDIIDYF